MCGDMLKVDKDTGAETSETFATGRGQGTGLGSMLNQQCDENCYFVDAKRIRVTVKNKETGELEKKEVTVHLECLKQLEGIRQLGKRTKEEAQQ